MCLYMSGGGGSASRQNHTCQDTVIEEFQVRCAFCLTNSQLAAVLECSPGVHYPVEHSCYAASMGHS